MKRIHRLFGQPALFYNGSIFKIIQALDFLEVIPFFAVESMLLVLEIENKSRKGA